MNSSIKGLVQINRYSFTKLVQKLRKLTQTLLNNNVFIALETLSCSKLRFKRYKCISEREPSK
ncbi:hypothetical protein BpHYR1_037866 [Brachionus plicatilis]|uniref:Uncharacterized protein n=1 Tax=Brachionus plicatilis TaxID=10195 RepID=A0A3M7RRI9_BRAPC|nr:hypothetical protein BpHYR1_037866 [Brachionus plicatilis]